MSSVTNWLADSATADIFDNDRLVEWQPKTYNEYCIHMVEREIYCNILFNKKII